MFAVYWWTGFYMMIMGLFLTFLQALDTRRAIEPNDMFVLDVG